MLQNTFCKKSVKIKQKKNTPFRKKALTLHPNNFEAF